MAIVLIAATGGYAYWSAQQQVTGNAIGSGTMTIQVTDDAGGAVVPMTVSGITPGDNNGATPAIFKVINPNTFNTDLVFRVSNVGDTKNLSENVQVAFLLCTGGAYNYWLTPAGTVNYNADSEWAANAHYMNEYDGKSWQDLTGYIDIPQNDFRTIKVFYILPLDCASDCHTDVATFDMTFEMMQSH